MDFVGNFSFKRSYFWLIYIRRHLQSLESLFFDSVGLLGLVTLAFQFISSLGGIGGPTGTCFV